VRIFLCVLTFPAIIRCRLLTTVVDVSTIKTESHKWCWIRPVSDDVFDGSVQPKFYLLRHDTTRYLAHAFWHRKKSWRAMSRLSISTARHARHDKCDSHDRVIATLWTGMDMSTSLFPEVVPETDATPEHKRLNLYTRALLLLRRSPCWNKHGATRTTSATRSSRHARHDTHGTSCVSCRDVTQQVEFELYKFEDPWRTEPDYRWPSLLPTEWLISPNRSFFVSRSC